MFSIRLFSAAAGLFCWACVGLALHWQHGLGMDPCPLCVIQRYAFLLAGLAAFAAALSRRSGPGLWGALGAALAGAWAAGEQLYVLAHPGTSCGIDPKETWLNALWTAKAAPWLFEARGLCEEAADRVAGLLIPQWAALAWAGLILALIWGLWRARAKPVAGAGV